MPGAPEEQTLPACPRRTPRGTPDLPHGCRPSASAQPLSPTAPTAELALTHFPARRAAVPRCPPARPPAALSPPRDAAPRPSPAVSPPRPGLTRGLPAGTEPSGASHRPTDRPTGCPGSGRYLRAVLQSLFQEELVHGGHVGAASRRNPGRSGVRGAGTPRRRGSAAPVPPSLRPAGAAPTLCRHRARLDGFAGEAEAAHSAQFPSAGGSESRAGRLPAAISSAGSGTEGSDGGRPVPSFPARVAAGSGFPQLRSLRAGLRKERCGSGPGYPLS